MVFFPLLEGLAKTLAPLAEWLAVLAVTRVRVRLRPCVAATAAAGSARGRAVVLVPAPRLAPSKDGPSSPLQGPRLLAKQRLPGRPS